MDLHFDLSESTLFASSETSLAPLNSSTPPKQVSLFSGNTITLKPRKSCAIDIDKISLDETDSIIDMDSLFSRVDFNKAMKESKEKLKQLEAEENKSKSVHKTSNPLVWSEKYKPTSFLQLCSAGNDKQYRHILHWLKKWSSVVFHEPPSTENADALGRPLRKILLVHGPLGIGKTAAVHLLVHQMGYVVQELNAANSMDALPQASLASNAFTNAAAALRLKIKNALTTNDITSGGAPSCLVIDEVDISVNSGDIIRVLSELCLRDQRSLQKNDKKSFLLTRPIICIANDLYQSRGSSMEKLRPLCEIVAFKKPTSKTGTSLRSVKDHLMKINQRENLKLDYQKIGDIVETCEGDIRACINYLQFNGRQLDVDIHGKQAGVNRKKDTQLSWFQMVDKLFKRENQLSKDENFDLLLDLTTNGEGKSATSSSGSLDKVMRGCFNRYLDAVHYQDDSLVKPAVLSDWLYFYDSILNDDYASLAALKVWSLFSEIHPKKTYDGGLIPNVRNLEFDSFEQLKKNKASVKRFIEKLPISYKLSFGCGASESSPSFVYQVLPYIDSLMNIDPVMVKKGDDRLTKVADLVKKFDLRLEQQRDLETNITTLHMAPSWDEIVTFDNFFAPVNFTVKNKQIQSRRQRTFPLIQELFVQQSAEKLQAKRPAETVEKEKKKARVSSVDFFRNQYLGMSQATTPKKRADHESTRIWVKYNEGFSNAVRKNIGWADLWRG